MMKKVIVIGCPGSGKSTFSRALRDATGLPLFHLDMMCWNADQTRVERTFFLERLEAVLTTDAWIIDGNYASTMERRMQACDTVIFLDYPTELCLEGIVARRGKARPDMPFVASGAEDTEFLAFIKDYQAQSRPQVLKLLGECREKEIHVFSDRAEADAFLHRCIGG